MEGYTMIKGNGMARSMDFEWMNEGMTQTNGCNGLRWERLRQSTLVSKGQSPCDHEQERKEMWEENICNVWL